MIRRVLAWLGLVPPPSGWCVCGHQAEGHEHYTTAAATYCAWCGWRDCSSYRDDPHGGPANMHDVLADDQAIDAVEAGDIDHALLLAPPASVALLVALRDLREVTR